MKPKNISIVVATAASTAMVGAVLAQTPSADRPTPAISAQRAWTRECAAHADQERITGGQRDVFMRECVAGEKVDASRPSRK